jgi:hypothetical protein
MNEQQRAVVQQALEAFEHLHRTGDTQVFDMCYAPKLIPALRQLLEQPADHSEQDLDMVENGDLLTIVYMDGLHTGKRMAKREWVGLTADEMLEALIAVDPATKRLPIGFARFAQAVEAKLKEKNT